MMQFVTVSNEVAASLSDKEELYEVRNEEGKIIGFFAPVTMENADRYARAAATVPAKGPGRTGPPMTTAELISHVQSLESR